MPACQAEGHCRKYNNEETMNKKIKIILAIVCLMTFNLVNVYGDSGPKHDERTQEYLGGQRYYDQGKSTLRPLHSQIIDKVPWKRFYGEEHQRVWGHTEDWYLGNENAYTTIAQDLIDEDKKLNKTLTLTQALAKAHEYLPKGGGRTLIMNAIRQQYGNMLSEPEIALLADQAFYIHLMGDDGYMKRQKLSNIAWYQKIQTNVMHPPVDSLLAKTKVDLIEFLKTTKEAPHLQKHTFVYKTIDNYERYLVANIANESKGIRIFNDNGAKIFGIEIAGKNHFVSMRSDVAHIIKLANRNIPVLVKSDVYEKILKRPEGKKLIEQHLIKRIEDHVPKNILAKYNYEAFDSYVQNLMNKYATLAQAAKPVIVEEKVKVQLVEEKPPLLKWIENAPKVQSGEEKPLLKYIEESAPKVQSVEEKPSLKYVEKIIVKESKFKSFFKYIARKSVAIGFIISGYAITKEIYDSKMQGKEVHPSRIFARAAVGYLGFFAGALIGSLFLSIPLVGPFLAIVFGFIGGIGGAIGFEWLFDFIMPLHGIGWNISDFFAGGLVGSVLGFIVGGAVNFLTFPARSFLATLILLPYRMINGCIQGFLIGGLLGALGFVLLFSF
jgi:hypothetical protein